MWSVSISSRCRHNGRDGVSNHQPRDCLLNCLFSRRSKKISQLRVTGLCAGNSPANSLPQRASNTENVSIWWRHQVHLLLTQFTIWQLVVPRDFARFRWSFWMTSSARKCCTILSKATEITKKRHVSVEVWIKWPTAILCTYCIRQTVCVKFHYDDVIMTTMASKITSLAVVYSAVYSGAEQRKHQSSASLAFVRGIHRDRWIPRTKGQ